MVLGELQSKMESPQFRLISVSEIHMRAVVLISKVDQRITKPHDFTFMRERKKNGRVVFILLLYYVLCILKHQMEHELSSFTSVMNLQSL